MHIELGVAKTGTCSHVNTQITGVTHIQNFFKKKLIICSYNNKNQSYLSWLLNEPHLHKYSETINHNHYMRPN